MTAFERAFRCALLTVLLALGARRRPGRGPRVQGAGLHPGGRRAACVDRGRREGDQGSRQGPPVHRQRDRRPDGVPRRPLKQFRAVVFLNTSGDVLDGRPAGRLRGVLPRRRRLRRHPLGDRDRARLVVPDRRPRHARHRARRVAAGTVKVADRVHDATKRLPEYWHRTDQWYNFAANVRGVSHVLATASTRRRTPAGRWASTTPSPGARTTGRPLVLHGRRRHRGRVRGAALPRAHLAGGIEWAAGEADPVYSDCGATVLANYEQTKISAPPNLNEPIGFDQLPDGRVIQTARGGQLRLHDPRDNSHPRSSRPARLHQQRGRAVRPGGRQRLRHQPLGLPLLRAAEHGPPYPPSTPAAPRRHASRRTRARGTPGRATSSSRASSSSTARPDARPRERAEDPQGREQPRRVLPRRRRHRLRPPQQPLAGHGRRHARGRRELRRLLAVQRHAHERDADGRASRARAADVHADVRRPDHGAARVRRDRAQVQAALEALATSATSPPGGPATRPTSVNFRGALSERTSRR